MYLISIGIALALGGIAALVLRFELLSPDKIILTAKQYNQAFTLHGAIMVSYLSFHQFQRHWKLFLPLQIGTNDVAFPRLNLTSYYLYVFGALFCIISIILGAVDAGWTFYTPYSTTTDTSVISMVTGAFILGFSSILTGVNFIATVHYLRAPGMGWFKMPLFVWSLYATSIIRFSNSVLGITLLLLILERAFGIGIFDPTIGGDPYYFNTSFGLFPSCCLHYDSSGYGYYE